MQTRAPVAAAPSLLERGRELRALTGLVEGACAGHGRVALVEGPPGIGKTRLLEAARALAGERGMRVLAGRASEVDRQFPFGVVRQLLEPLVAGSAARERTRLLQGAARLAAPVLGLDSEEDDAAAGEGDPALARFHALYWLLANLVEEGPAALVIDDLHWADPASLRFLQFLAPRLEELPLLLALATRPPEPGTDRQPLDALATDPLTVVLRPPPLGEHAVAELVAAELGNDPESSFVDACREATGGNPFLLRELLRELRSDGVEPADQSASLVRQLAPPTVARAVLLRLARLGEDASKLARAVAVLGDRAPTRRASALAGMVEADAERVATALEQSGIFARGRPLAFAHPILRSVVYSEIDPAERGRAHRRAAALFAAEGADADAIAAHLLATEPAADASVVVTLREAADRALRRGAAATAVACLRRALAEPPPSAERASVVVELASAELRAGEPAAACEHFGEAMRVVSDPRSRAACVEEQTLALQAAGRHDEAFALREAMVEELMPVDPELALVIEAGLVASASLDLTRLPWARARIERHRGQLSVATRGGAALLATQACLDAFDGKDPADALADAAETALVSGRLHDRVRWATPFFLAVEVLVLADRLEPARRALDHALDDARRRGSAPRFAFASGWRCWLLAREGALVEAEADARSCAELSLAQGWFTVAPLMLGYALDVLVDRSELEDAELLLERSGMADRPADQDLTLDPVVHARARLRAARGDLARARADLDALHTRTPPRPSRWNTHPILAPAIVTHRELSGDDAERERESVERMLREAREWGTPRAMGMALRAAGLTHGGRRGLDLLEEATAVLGSSLAPLEYAEALTDLGAGLRRDDQRVAARDPLRRALDLADAHGARRVAERAHRELLAAGGRPRRARATGAGALTASERRIAALAADGLSNPEIGQSLFITKKTVETHLSNAYRKLGISSRTELGAALEKPSSGGDQP